MKNMVRKLFYLAAVAGLAFGAFADEAGGVWVKFAFRKIVKDGNTIQLSELGIFDQDGNRLNLSLGGVNGADPKDLAVKKFTTNGHGATATDAYQGVSSLFDNGGSKLCKSLSPIPKPNDETTWWEVTMRLSDDAKPLAYNLRTADDSETVRSPVSWTVFISENGTDWTPVDARDDQSYPTTHNTWYNGGANYTFRYPWIPFEVSKAADVVPYVGAAPYRCGVTVNDYADPSKVLAEGEDYEVAYENADGVGTASVTVTGKGSVYGGATWSSTYRIVPGLTVALLRSEMPYAGGAARECGVAVSNYNGTAELVENVHYKVEYANNTEIGTATVTVTGLGDYAANSQALNFAIEPGFVVYKLRDVMSVDAGDPLVCGVVVSNYAGTAELREGVDYTVEYANNTAVGKATVTVTGINDYAGNVATDTFDVAPWGVWVRVEFRRVAGGTKEVQLSELAFYDAQTNRVNLSLSDAGVNKPAHLLSARQFTATSTTGNDPTVNAFDGNMGSKMCRNSTTSVPMTLTMRLKDDALPVAYNFATANDSFTSRSPVSWTVWASRDALNWTAVNVQDGQPYPAAQYTWYNGGTNYTFGYTWIPFAAEKAADVVPLAGEPPCRCGVVVRDIEDPAKVLTEGTDYKAVYENAGAVGTASVTVIGKGETYGGQSWSSTYEIVPGLTVSLLRTAMPYAGGAARECGVAVSNYNGTVELVENVHYKVEYANNTEIGTATVTVTGLGDYAANSQVLNFEIEPGFWVSLLRPTMPYGGGVARECGVVVSNYSGTAELVENVDYKVDYANNTEIGTATVTVTGLGDYAAFSQVLNFEIEPGFVVYKLHDLVPYAEGEPVVCGVAVSNFAGTVELVENVHYKVEYANNSAVGTATVTVTGLGELAGNVTTDTFEITPKGVWVRVEFRKINGGPSQLQLSELALYDKNTNRVNLSLADAGVGKPAHLLSPGQFTATATSGNEPVVSIFDGSTGTKMCRNISGYPMTITMRLKDDAMPVAYNFATANDSETSRSPVSWTVWASKDAATWTPVSVLDDQKYPTTHYTWYNGETNWLYRYPWIPMEMQIENRVVPFSGVREYTCGVIVTDYENYETLTEGVDYDVAYSNNTKVGTATVTVTGRRGKYRGAVLTDTFEIASSMYVRFLDDSAEYDYVHPCTIRIEVLSEEGGEPLVEGVHYRVDYANNAAVGKATATVTGIGDFEGNAATHEFTVVSAFPRIPAKYTIVSPSDPRKIVKRGEELMLKDKSISGFVTDADYATGYMMDFGTPRRVRRIGVGPRDGFINRACNYRAYGSNDLADWTLLRSGDPDMAERSLNEVPVTNGTDRSYRYVRITNLENLNEIAAFSDDLMVELTSDALPFASTACAAADAASVPVKGRVIKAPHGAPRVLAFAARTDFGDNYAAWQAQAGARIDFGEVAKGGTFQGGFEGLAKGRWHWRVFAVDAEGASASQLTVPFTVGTRVVYPKAYVANAALAKCYDKGTGYWGDASGNLWIVFDLKGAVPENFKIDGIRAWDREGLQARMRGAAVDFGWDPAEGPVDWGAETDKTIDPSRPVAQVSGVPAGIVWKGDVANFVEQSVNNYGSPYVLFQKVKASNPPRYVRIRDFPNGNISEIELRALRQPGTALIVR